MVNLGTNNFYDDGDTVEEATEGLQRLFAALHNEFPEARIYYFSIAQRVCKDYRLQISKTNATLKEWCSEREWITFLDIEERLTEDMLRDGLHPKLDAYSLFLDALFEAGIQLENIGDQK